MILIQALCMQAPEGFCERIGVAEEKETATAWVLSRRETRMLNALIRAEKEKGGIDIHSRPQLICLDNQTGFVQVGQEVPVITKVETEEKDGTTITKTTTEKRARRFDTPRHSARFRRTVRQSCSAPRLQHTDRAPSARESGESSSTAPAFNSQKMNIAVSLPDGGTAVFRGGTRHRRWQEAARSSLGAHAANREGPTGRGTPCRRAESARLGSSASATEIPSHGAAG